MGPLGTAASLHPPDDRTPFLSVRDLGVFFTGMGRKDPECKRFYAIGSRFPLAPPGEVVGSAQARGNWPCLFSHTLLSDLQNLPLPPRGFWEGSLVKGALAPVSKG